MSFTEFTLLINVWLMVSGVDSNRSLAYRCSCLIHSFDNQIEIGIEVFFNNGYKTSTIIEQHLVVNAENLLPLKSNTLAKTAI